MQFDHMIKVNGEYYPAGADVPDGKPTVTADTEKAVTPRKTPGRKPAAKKE